MSPQELFCPNMGNIHAHSQKEKRCICEVCEQTFTATRGTIFFRLRSDPQLVMWVIILLAHGCPLQAIVKAFGLDERTACDWQTRTGQHYQQVHEHLVENSQHDLQQVQSCEIKVKLQKGTIWMALGIWVPTRLWMGRAISPMRVLDLIQALADQVRKMALCRPLLLAVDGLVSYVNAFRNAFRSKFPHQAGELEHCKMVAWQETSSCNLSNSE